MKLTFTIPGELVPWMRAASKGRRRYTPPRQKAYQDRVRWAALQAFRCLADGTMTSRPTRKGWPLDARYAVSVDAHRKAKTGDVDNFAKSVLDALNRVVWNDDRQVDELLVRRRALEDGQPRTVVTVEVIA